MKNTRKRNAGTAAMEESLYIIYKNCPGQPHVPVKQVRGHYQALHGSDLLDLQMSEEEKKGGCIHSAEETE
jgi:hypothetical protein